MSLPVSLSRPPIHQQPAQSQFSIFHIWITVRLFPSAGISIYRRKWEKVHQSAAMTETKHWDFRLDVRVAGRQKRTLIMQCPGISWFSTLVTWEFQSSCLYSRQRKSSCSHPFVVPFSISLLKIPIIIPSFSQFAVKKATLCERALSKTVNMLFNWAWCSVHK